MLDSQRRAHDDDEEEEEEEKEEEEEEEEEFCVMCFKNCFISVAYTQVHLGSISSCKLHEMGFIKI
jgi:hypothetical protein